MKRRVAAATTPALLAAALFATLALLAWLVPRPGFWATKLLVALAVVAFTAALWREVGRGNREVARFLSALEHGDLAQSFRSRRGAGLDRLGDTLDRALGRLRDERRAAAGENRFAAVLADEAPTPLLAIDPQGRVHLANKAARRLFREADGQGLAAFARYGEDFADLLGAMTPGRRAVSRVLWNGLSHRAVLQAVAVERQGAPWRVVSIDLIQGELEAAELATQTDLVRVLTHEIMNSLTPVTSLAGSAERLLADAQAGDADAVEEARMAVASLARRAAGIARFVDSYRDFSHAPAIDPARFAVRPWLDELVRTFAAMPQAAGVAIQATLDPEGAQIDADAGLLGQVLLNLMKNAAEAATAAADTPRVAVAVTRNDAGRTVIAVEDNGTGIAEGLEDEVFLPFFTTKREGTGVGLSFARQVVTLHGGSIGATRGADGGARFVIVV